MPPFPLKGIPAPEEAEVWHLDGRNVYVVYTVPGTNIPMAWHIEDLQALSTIFGGRAVQFDRQMTSEQFQQTGGLFFGGSAELVNLADHPFDALMANLEAESTTQPWLRDPEVLATTFAATLEGRTPTPGELQSTDWFQSHNDAQRAWMLLSSSDPATASQTIDANRRRVRDALAQSGATETPDWLVGEIADLFTRGDLSDAQLADTLRGITDPFANVSIPRPVLDAIQERLGEDIQRRDEDAVKRGWDAVRARVASIFRTRRVSVSDHGLDRMTDRVLNGGDTLTDIRAEADQRAFQTPGARPGGLFDLDSTQEGEEQVRQLARRWLGPVHGDKDNAWVARWAGRVRNDPDAQQELVSTLRAQLQNLYGVEDPSTTWEDLAQPWITMASNTWQTSIDPTDPLVDRLIRLNDGMEAGRLLRNEGINRGVEAVTNDILQGLHATVGGGFVPTI